MASRFSQLYVAVNSMEGLHSQNLRDGGILHALDIALSVFALWRPEMGALICLKFLAVGLCLPFKKNSSFAKKGSVFVKNSDCLAKNGREQGPVMSLLHYLSGVSVAAKYQKTTQTRLSKMWLYCTASLTTPGVGLAWWRESNDVIRPHFFPFSGFVSHRVAPWISERFSAVPPPASSLCQVQWLWGVGWEAQPPLQHSWQKPYCGSLALGESVTPPESITVRGMIRPMGIAGGITSGAMGGGSCSFMWTESGDRVVPQMKILLYGEDWDSEGPALRLLDWAALVRIGWGVELHRDAQRSQLLELEGLLLVPLSVIDCCVKTTLKPSGLK